MTADSYRVYAPDSAACPLSRRALSSEREHLAALALRRGGPSVDARAWSCWRVAGNRGVAQPGTLFAADDAARVDARLWRQPSAHVGGVDLVRAMVPLAVVRRVVQYRELLAPFSPHAVVWFHCCGENP